MIRQWQKVGWDEEGIPFSPHFSDVYFSRFDGLAESREVYLAGCGLPERWRARRTFTVAELGFGCGRNILALFDLWRHARPHGAKLTVFSIEARPMASHDAARALASWPELTDIAARLLAQWPPLASGFHRLDFPEISATLDLAFMEAAEALQAWTGHADAWFLDGFSPERNPDIWRPQVMRLLAARSASGAKAASYTAAGSVRRALEGAGFAVARLPGAGAKRHRLEARWLGGPDTRRGEASRGAIAIIGGGIAGASLARAFGELGAEACVYEFDDGASALPAALAAPRLDAGLAAPARLYAQAARRALRLYGAVPGAVVARGLLQLEGSGEDQRRFAKIADSDLFPPGSMALLSASETGARIGEPAGCGLYIGQAAVLDPSEVLSAWKGRKVRRRIAVLQAHAGGWRGLDEEGGEIFKTKIVCLAAGLGSAWLRPELALLAVRGQASLASGIDLRSAVAFGGWALPAASGVFFGATHDRGDEGEDVRGADEGRVLDLVQKRLPRLGGRLARAPRTSFAGVRAATSDYLPLVGSIDEGLYTLCGLGSRGFTLAPLLAEHLVSEALGLASPLPAQLQRIISPSRFSERAARRRGLADRPPNIGANQ
ncbi:MAG: tRNA (5-methylaminomethyl-2-thiouridine)(34)-methyltransferase MnmD [Caulobacteraceae bacterium]